LYILLRALHSFPTRRSSDLLGTINDQLVDFGDFYRRTDASQIREVLDRLFRDTCGVWYANRGHLEPLNLTREYQKLLEDTSEMLDRKSTRLNSSHLVISYAV